MNLTLWMVWRITIPFLYEIYPISSEKNNHNNELEHGFNRLEGLRIKNSKSYIYYSLVFAWLSHFESTVPLKNKDPQTMKDLF